MVKVKRDNEHRVTRGILRAGNSTFDFLFIALMITLLIIAGYMKMDIDSVYEDADPAKFIMYKPELPDDTETFEDLQKLNPDVIGWITIYDTNIDYPVVKGEDARGNKGTGLGLSIAENNLNILGYKLELVSEEGTFKAIIHFR